jgi:ketosteroid isomerase-like protein
MWRARVCGFVPVGRFARDARYKESGRRQNPVPMTSRDRFLEYLRAYESRDIDRVAALLADDVSLRDWKIAVRGKAAAVAETQANFEAARSIEIQPQRLHVGEASVAGELRILVDGHIELFVVDVLDFDPQGKITAIRAFLGRGDAESASN